MKRLVTGALLAAPFAIGCHDVEADPHLNKKPAHVLAIAVRHYDGDGDDLLTGGLGKDGLASATPPAFADPDAPAPDELRRLAIYTNYRALVDTSANGGFGRLFGPNIDLEGKDTLGGGKVAGAEYVGLADDGEGGTATVMVQVPDAFPKAAKPCIVTATSSGSRGVYGAIGAAGEWGLKRGCAVAYTDKGTGNGVVELSTGRVTLIDGQTSTMTDAGDAAPFSPGNDAEVAGFVASHPGRYAFKHAHSRQNPERNWGLFTLRAIELAFYAINDRFGDKTAKGQRVATYVPGGGTIVIATSVSNGGGAALAAAELDDGGVIQGVVAGEPQIGVDVPADLVVERGGAPVASFGRPLYDYVTIANLLEPCAAFAKAAVGSPLLPEEAPAPVVARCAALAADGVIRGATFADQAEDALAKLHDAGWEAESDVLHWAHWSLQAVPAVAVTYANAYARASVAENLCGYSFSPAEAKTGKLATPPRSPLLNVFGAGNGIPPTDGIALVYDGASPAADHRFATPDLAYAGAKCLRALWTDETDGAARVHQGVGEVLRKANLHGKPAIVVQGRSDTLIPVNHGSRAYYGVNHETEGKASKLVLYEVENAQHFDAFLGLPGFDTRFVPLHVYVGRALNVMWAALTKGDALPPSQVVRTTPRGGAAGKAPPLADANVPQIASKPAVADAITVEGHTVHVPD